MSDKENPKSPKKKSEPKKKSDSIYDRLRNIQQKLKAPKNQFNSFGNYNYRNCDDILEAVKPLLAETGTTLTIDDDILQLAGRFYVKATASLSYNFASISVSAYAREPESKKGMDSAQITGATSSYARKYALNGLFAIDDAKDADSMDNRETPKKQAPPKKNEINPAQSKVLNYIIEKLAPFVDDGSIVDINKLKKVIIAEYKSLPSKMESADTVLKYIKETLGIENVVSENTFLKGL